MTELRRTSGDSYIGQGRARGRSRSSGRRAKNEAEEGYGTGELDATNPRCDKVGQRHQETQSVTSYLQDKVVRRDAEEGDGNKGKNMPEHEFAMTQA